MKKKRQEHREAPLVRLKDERILRVQNLLNGGKNISAKRRQTLRKITGQYLKIQRGRLTEEKVKRARSS